MADGDAVAGLPGGGAFDALWQQVNGDPGSIEDLAALFHTAAGKATESSAHVGKAATEVREAWKGDASSSFGNYMSSYAKAGAEVSKGLTNAATALTSAANAVSTAKASLNAIAGRLIDESNTLEAQLRSGDMESAEYQKTMSAAVAEACSEAQPHVTTLTAALESAASKVKSATSGRGYLSLHATSDATYLPEKGKPIEWSPVVKTSSTSPAGSSGGGGSTGGGGGGSTSGGGGGTTSGGPPEAQPTGDVKTWIDQAIKLLEANGVKPSQINAADINTIIQHESSGNPHAENDWDSNAAAGHPSKGLMQTIDSTFDAHALPGHTDIWNPVDNIVAGVRYALSRYGSLDNVPGIQAVHNGGSYVGY